MANPQKENGGTIIANEIMDALCRFRIPGNVRQIIDAIIRKTYGWNKKEDWISNSQIVEITGLLKGIVSRELSKAITHKIVIEHDNKLQLNKNYEEWISFSGQHFNPNPSKIKLSDTITTKKLSDTISPVIVSDNKVIVSEGNKIHYTKYTNTKDSKNSLIPCTDKELQQISIDLNMPISRVQLKHETILDKIAAGEYKYKTVYRTLREWLRRDKEKLLPIIAKTPEEIEEDKILNAPYPPGALEWKMGIKI